MTLRTAWRKSLNVFMLSLTGVCALITVSALGVILGYLAWNGATSLHWSFFTNVPRPSGRDGGWDRECDCRVGQDAAACGGNRDPGRAAGSGLRGRVCVAVIRHLLCAT